MGGALVLRDADGAGAKFTLTLQAASAPEAEQVMVSGSPNAF